MPKYNKKKLKRRKK